MAMHTTICEKDINDVITIIGKVAVMSVSVFIKLRILPVLNAARATGASRSDFRYKAAIRPERIFNPMVSERNTRETRDTNQATSGGGEGPIVHTPIISEPCIMHTLMTALVKNMPRAKPTPTLTEGNSTPGPAPPCMLTT